MDRINDNTDDSSPFNDQFDKKVLALLRSNRADAGDELLRIYEETLKYYDEHGLTEYWGPEPKAEADEGKAKKSDKPTNLLTVGRPRPTTVAAASRSSSPINAPSPTPSPSMPAVKRVVAEVNIFGDIDKDSPMAKRAKTLKKEQLQPLPLEPMTMIVDETNSAESSSNSIDISFAVGNDGVCCSVCRDLSVEVGNTLVTCDECSRLYHQACHNPIISTLELRDPRFIFVCMNCKEKRTKTTTNLKSILTTTTAAVTCSTTATTSSNLSTDGTSATGVKMKPIDKSSSVSTKSSPPTNTLFKPTVPLKDRMSPTTAMPSATAAVQSPTKGGGIAVLAADFLAKRAGKVILPKSTDTLPFASNIGKPATQTANNSAVMFQRSTTSQSTFSTTKSTVMNQPLPPPPPPPSTTMTTAKVQTPMISPMQGAERRLQAMKKKAAQGKAFFK